MKYRFTSHYWIVPSATGFRVVDNCNRNLGDCVFENSARELALSLEAKLIKRPKVFIEKEETFERLRREML